MITRPPRIALTLGDVAGIGPEVIARAWTNPKLHELARLFVVGQASVLERACALVRSTIRIITINDPEQANSTAQLLRCLETGDDVSTVLPGQVDAGAGRAAFQFLNTAIDLALAGRIEAITTLPLNKESLNAAGIEQPGHTEILAKRCGAKRHAMLLYMGPPMAKSETGLGVVHVTLHMPLRTVFDVLNTELIENVITLGDSAMRPFTRGRPVRMAVAGLNPHAGEHGLFGDEEPRIIAPAVARSRERGLDVSGPIAADTLFRRALDGEFDCAVAMYHDQGHVALKTVGFRHAVNVTVGLPIVRTSVAHGTAFDIAWKGRADATNLVEAVRVAARLVQGRETERCAQPIAE